MELPCSGYNSHVGHLKVSALVLEESVLEFSCELQLWLGQLPGCDGTSTDREKHLAQSSVADLCTFRLANEKINSSTDLGGVCVKRHDLNVKKLINPTIRNFNWCF